MSIKQFIKTQVFILLVQAAWFTYPLVELYRQTTYYEALCHSMPSHPDCKKYRRYLRR
jgi:hypothetical protein